MRKDVRKKDAKHHNHQEDNSHRHPSIGKVLVLNANYEPITICKVEKAIVLVYLNKAVVVSERERRLLTATGTFPFPSIIRLASYVHVPFKKVILSRKNILKRDGGKCHYCGSAGGTLTVDHVLPKSRGGMDSWDNLITACLRCNNKKGDSTPEEAGMPLIAKPVRPNHVTFLRQFVGKRERDWEPYLFH